MGPLLSPAHKLPEASQRTALLEKVTLFADIKQIPEALGHLTRAMQEREFKPGQVIIQEGQDGSEMFFLFEGKVSVRKNTPSGDSYRVVDLDGSLVPFFGEGSLIDSETRSASIVAETFCRCLSLERAAFEKYCDEHPQWALPIFRRIARVVMTRLRKTSNDMMLLYNALVGEIRGE